MNGRFASMPGHLLRRCQQIAVAIFLEECQRFALTPLQFAVLDSLMQSGEQDQVTLGGAVALDRSSTSLVIAKLEKLGLLHRRPSTSDKRARKVQISAAGAELLNQVLPMVESAQQRILAPLNPPESKQLLALLEKLAEGNNALSRAPERIKTIPAK
ncbi:MAG: DNA-binding MarR family transcriptional regulator [Planctomycetota bacterium]|jgi:DNA-binding MarR family transcriptional regulator